MAKFMNADEIIASYFSSSLWNIVVYKNNNYHLTPQDGHYDHEHYTEIGAFYIAQQTEQAEFLALGCINVKYINP